MNKQAEADACCVWVPSIFAKFVAQMTNEEMRNAVLRANRELDAGEQDTIAKLVMSNVVAHIMPAGNA